MSDFLRCVPAYPTDILCYTRAELEEKVAAGEPFITRALGESIQLYR